MAKKTPKVVTTKNPNPPVREKSKYELRLERLESGYPDNHLLKLSRHLVETAIERSGNQVYPDFHSYKVMLDTADALMGIVEFEEAGDCIS